MANTRSAYTPLHFFSSSSRFISSDNGDLSDPTEEPVPAPNVSTIVLSITTVIFALYSLYLSLLPTDEISCPWQSTARQRELADQSVMVEPAKASIELQEVMFTNALQYNETSKEYYREHDPGEEQYVGKPSPEIDEAWEELLGGQYLLLTQEEGRQLNDAVLIQGLYLAEVEAMHSLHCLNMIRKALNAEYYSTHEKQSLPAQLKAVHIEHCIEQLRQTIQCAGDRTPVPLRPYGEGENLTYIGTSQVHTCRNWDIFRKWYSERGDEYGKINGD